MILDFHNKLKAKLENPETLNAIAAILSINPESMMAVDDRVKGQKPSVRFPLAWTFYSSEPHNETISAYLYRYIRYSGDNGIAKRDCHTLANFTVSLFPGNGDVLVSQGVGVAQDWRSKSLGSFLNNCRTQVAKDAGASAMIATVNTENAHERAILFKNGWAQMRSYIPKYGGQNAAPVEFWVKQL